MKSKSILSTLVYSTIPSKYDTPYAPRTNPVRFASQHDPAITIVAVRTEFMLTLRQTVIGHPSLDGLRLKPLRSA